MPNNRYLKSRIDALVDRVDILEAIVLRGEKPQEVPATSCTLLSFEDDECEACQ